MDSEHQKLSEENKYLHEKTDKVANEKDVLELQEQLEDIHYKTVIIPKVDKKLYSKDDFLKDSEVNESIQNQGVCNVRNLARKVAHRKNYKNGNQNN